MATGLLSKDIKLSYKLAAAFVELPDLQEIPELGGDVDKVEVTTLADGARRYINGIKDYGAMIDVDKIRPIKSSVKSSDINSLVNKLLSTKPTKIVVGDLE